jgi:hypothetical protein
MPWAGNIQENGHKTSGVFYMTSHLHMGVCVQEMPFSAQCDGSDLNHQPYSPDLSPADSYVTKSVLKGQTFSTVEEATVSDESTDRGIKKWFPGTLSKASPTFAIACHCPLIPWRKCCVSRCKITYPCAINQFRDLFNANSMLTATLSAGPRSYYTKGYKHVLWCCSCSLEFRHDLQTK